MAKTNSGLVAYAKAQVGLPYWYGTFGQIATESLLESKKKRYSDYYEPWNDFLTQIGKRVHDCVGLIKGYLWSDTATSTPKYVSAQDKSAQGMYAASTLKGTIDAFPKHAGQLVYKSTVKTDAKKIHHVGVYIGDGYVIEAKGHEYGVVKTKLSGAGWTHWSQCPYIEDDTVSTPRSYAKDYEGSYIVTDKSVYIREGAGTGFRAIAVIKRDTIVSCKGYFNRVDGTVWLEVRTANVTGWMSTKYLKKV